MFSNRSPAPRPATAGVSVHVSEDGLTLVELMVAILLLGIILTATAASLVTFGVNSGVNEQRVRATALLTAEIERFQSTDFDLLANYANEVPWLCDPTLKDPDDFAEVPGLGRLLRTSSGATLGAEGAGCTAVRKFADRVDAPPIEAVDFVRLEAPADPSDREAGVPPAIEQVTHAGVDYTIFRVYSAIDRQGEVGVRRFTAIVRWEAFGREYEETFVGERAPTLIEAESSEPPPLLIFEPNFSRMPLRANGQMLQDLEFALYFGVDVTDVRLQFQHEGGAADIPLGSPVSRDGVNYHYYTASLDRLTYQFAPPSPASPDPEDGEEVATPVAATTFDVIARRVDDGVAFAAGSVRVPMPDWDKTELLPVVGLTSVAPVTEAVQLDPSGDVCTLQVVVDFDPTQLPPVRDDDGTPSARAYGINLLLVVNDRSVTQIGLVQDEVDPTTHQAVVDGDRPGWQPGDGTPVVVVVAPNELSRFAAFDSGQLLTFQEVGACP